MKQNSVKEDETSKLKLIVREIEAEFDRDEGRRNKWYIEGLQQAVRIINAVSAIHVDKDEKEETPFEDYMRNTRNEFVEAITKYFPHEQKTPQIANMRTEIRVAAEDLLICFDQMRDKILV